MVLFGISTWERGLAYARQHRVETLELESDPNANPGWTLDATVRGSETYNVWLDLGRDESGRWWFDSGCDCPVGFRCKHQAAVVLTLSQRHPEVVTPHRPTPGSLAAPASTPTSTTQPVWWQPTSLPPPPPPPPPPPAPPPPRVDVEAERWFHTLPVRDSGTRLTNENELVLFALCEEPASARQAPRLRLVPARVTLLKRTGAMGKLRLTGSSISNQARRSDDADLRELVDALDQMQLGQSWNTEAWGTLNNRLALLLLPRLLASGRVVHAEPDGSPSAPWSWGEPRPLQWEWVEHTNPDAPSQTPDQRCWRLRPRALGSDGQPTVARIYIHKCALYLDALLRQVGPLDLEGLDVEQAEQMLLAPPMREGWLRAQPKLRQRLPSLPATVAEPVARRVRGATPSLVLRLSWLRSDAVRSGELDINLSFDYDGVRSFWSRDAERIPLVITAEGLVEVVRDLDAEARCLAALSRSAQPARQVHPLAPSSSWCLLGASPQERQAHTAAALASDFAPWRSEGFVLEFGDNWSAHTHQIDDVQADLSAADDSGWLSLALGFSLDGRQVNLLPMVPQLIAQLDTAKRELPERVWVMGDDGRWWGLSSEPLRPWVDTLLELVGDRPGQFNADSLRLSPLDALRLGADQAELGGDGHAVLRDILSTRQLGAALPPAPEGLAATPRPYQLQGSAWLRALARHRLGGVLADDMGLGKTLQAIAHLLAEKNDGLLDVPALVVAPTSLVGNWRRECRRFAPGLKVLVLHGNSRHDQFAAIAGHDVVLTTYPLLIRDAEVLVQHQWHALVLDEAQVLKNAQTQTAQTARRLNARHRIALTGTPMENHLGELWSLFDLVLPGYLGRLGRFTTLFRQPIEKHGDSRRLALLRRRLTPFMLRRDKSTVATELPPKIEQVVRVQLPPTQANLYETIRVTTEETVRDALSDKGLARSQVTVLDALLKLRQVCCDPRLVKLSQARRIHESAKLEWLMETLPQMIEEGRRVLLFSQFTSMLELIEEKLHAAGLRWVKLTGQSQHRDALVEEFTSGAVPIFLISLKAGGVGLNLPQADTVIHYDPWWNPAVENQATDRAHRMGQTQTVFVYKLVAEGTLEERILALQARKAELARGVRGDGSGQTKASLTEQDLNWLLQPLGAAAAADADLATDRLIDSALDSPSEDSRTTSDISGDISHDTTGDTTNDTITDAIILSPRPSEVKH